MCLAAPLRQPPPAVDGVLHSAPNETTRPHMAQDEPLRQLHQMFPSRHRDFLSAVLLQCNNRFQDAVNLIISSQLEDEVQDVGSQPASQGLPRSNAQPQAQPSSSSGVTLNLPKKCHIVNLFEKAASTNLLTCKQTSPTDNQYFPDVTTACYYSLTNGDCGPHALGTMLMQMTAYHPKILHKPIAIQVRKYIQEYLRLNWFNVSKISKQPWHEMMYLAHNLAVPPDERRDNPHWGPDPRNRLQKWEAECKNCYFSQSEFICFNEAMEAHGIFAVFRMWRQLGKDLKLLATIPENPASSDTHLVFDFKHSGGNDTVDAHWELLKSGSASPFFLRRAQQQQEVGKDEPKAEKKRVAEKERTENETTNKSVLSWEEEWSKANKKLVAARGEKKRLAAEAEQERLAAEANQKRLEEEANQKRLAGEVEQARLSADTEKARLAAEVEQARLAANAEKARLTGEVQQVHTEAEAEKARLAAEVEQARLAANAEKARLAVEVQQVRTEAEAEKARVAAKKQEAPEAAEAEMNKGDGISNRKQEEGVDLPRKRQKTKEARMLKELKEYSSYVVSDPHRLGIGVFSRPSGSRRGR